MQEVFMAFIASASEEASYFSSFLKKEIPLVVIDNASYKENIKNLVVHLKTRVRRYNSIPGRMNFLLNNPEIMARNILDTYSNRYKFLIAVKSP